MARSKRPGLFGIRSRLKAALGKAESAQPSGPVIISFEGSGEASFEAGTTLLDAAHKLDVGMSSYCGGHCSCGTCRIEVVSGAENLSEMRGNEQLVLGNAQVANGDRLACQARVQGPVTVRVPDWF